MNGGQPLTEKDLQLAIYNFRHRRVAYPTLLTNVHYWHWESDALYITDDYYFHEFEIKTTHADFLNEFKHKVDKLIAIEAGQGPTLFYYVCPPGIIKVEEVPRWAGLCYVEETYGCYEHEPPRILTLEIIKKAPRIATQRTTPTLDWKDLLGKLTRRYWDYKLGIENQKYYEKVRDGTKPNN